MLLPSNGGFVGAGKSGDGVVVLCVVLTVLVVLVALVVDIDTVVTGAIVTVAVLGAVEEVEVDSC